MPAVVEKRFVEGDEEGVTAEKGRDRVKVEERERDEEEE